MTAAEYARRKDLKFRVLFWLYGIREMRDLLEFVTLMEEIEYENSKSNN